MPSVDAELSAELERDFPDMEIALAIRAMQSGNSPGPDGFPAELKKKKKSNQLSLLLLFVFEEYFASNSLPPTIHQAVISLSLKKDKIHLNCRSYCPVSLLNTNAKILAQTLAHCLKKITPSIIASNQTGFVKNHYPILGSYLISFIVPLHPILGILRCGSNSTLKKHLTRF